MFCAQGVSMELIHASATAIFTRMTPSGAQDMVVPHGAINADHTQFIVEDRKNGPPCLNSLPCLTLPCLALPCLALPCLALPTRPPCFLVSILLLLLLLLVLLLLIVRLSGLLLGIFVEPLKGVVSERLILSVKSVSRDQDEVPNVLFAELVVVGARNKRRGGARDCWL